MRWQGALWLAVYIGTVVWHIVVLPALVVIVIELRRLRKGYEETKGR